LDEIFLTIMRSCISLFNRLKEEEVMQFSRSRRAATQLVVLAVALVLVAVTLSAQQPTKISGTITAEATRQDSIIVGDAVNHLISLMVSEGTNVNTGEHEFMDAAQVLNMSHSDLIQGNGVNQGYVRFTKDGDTVFAQWQGKITTEVMPEGNRLTGIEGTYTYIKGTGSLLNIKGQGTYKGEFTSATEYTVKWEGSYSIEE
jgi:hypothetical protein